MDIYNNVSGKLGLICFFIYLIMLMKGRRTYSGTMAQTNNYWFVFICMVLYSVLGFLETDTIRYYYAYEEMIDYGNNVFEPFYLWLATHLPHAFLLWRFVIWGGACVLMVMSAKLLKLDAGVFCFLVPLLFIIQLSVTRGAIGLALMIFCTIILIQSLEKRKTLLILIAIIGIIVSVFLHKSMIIFIFILLAAFIIPFNNKTMVASLILFPFLYIIVLQLFKDFSFFGQLNEDQVYLISVYQESDKLEKNINGILFTFFEKTVLLMLLFIMTKKYLYDRIETTKTHFFIFKYTYLMVYVSFLFLGQEVSNWVSDRTLHAGSFALILCATQCFDCHLTKQKRTLLEKIVIMGFLVITLWKQLSFIKMYW